MANQFWTRWLSEYLPILQERQKWFRPQKNIAVGDLVLITNYSMPRGHWPKGLVVQTYPDKKGYIRQARLRISNGYINRDVRKLCHLEFLGQTE